MPMLSAYIVQIWFIVKYDPGGEELVMQIADVQLVGCFIRAEMIVQSSHCSSLECMLAILITDVRGDLVMVKVEVKVRFLFRRQSHSVNGKVKQKVEE
jgi:hypothetical protein